ncbi:MAG TPA: hypothetical protein PKC18_00215 [Lacipirellulaceae bacterium]|nr:hypothetical protein [Lacipirellulaceae bacterium]HMP06492.1 hypothetical protein [Lacipirellulaceae bacterium]
MSKQDIFKCYGENGATFLLFQLLATIEGGIADLLLPRLKAFGAGKPRKDWGAVEDVEVWLFPNFGKGVGFGEPDVLVLAGGHAIWVEVETMIDSKRAMPSLQQSLVQLYRFHLLQKAIEQGGKTLKGARYLTGKTLSNSRAVRDAFLRLKGHGVIKHVRRRVAAAGKASQDHYALFTVNKPKGEGLSGRPYARVLSEEAKRIVAASASSDIPRLPIERCYYAYWKGDLEPEYHRASATSFTFDDHYVRIKR